ncbi:MAG: hypothetical protein HFJ60_09285 [Clostridia bacterium]|jgi:hypothetical protein|nr:hypothetical protein [Clostridia bacterium]
MKENIKKVEEKNKKNKKPIEFNFTIIAIVLIAILCICITPVTFQNDTYYTIKIGELIKNNGIDMMDHFSWHEDLSYTYPHWLYDLCTYLVYSIAGFKSVYILTCILSVILGISIFLVNSKLTKNKAISFIVTVGALYMLQNYIAARAQLVTFILFIWEIFCIEKFIENRKIIYGAMLVLISLLIANLHVATWPFFFVLFLPYIGEYVISVISDIVIYSKIRLFILNKKAKRLTKKNKNLDKLEEINKEIETLKNNISKIKIKRDEDRKNPYKITIKRNNNVRFLIIVMILCALMGLLTPIKDTPYTYLYKTMQGNTTDNISEHLPLTISKSTDVMCMLIIFLAILIFTKAKIRLSDLFMISGLCYLMLSTRRQTSMFVLIGSVVLTRLIVDLIKRYTKNGLEEVEKAVRHIGVVIALTALMLCISLDAIQPKFDAEYVNSSAYPVAACDYILENIDLEGVRFYNEYNYGSYMLFRGIPVFIDSRADLYAPEFSGKKDEDIFSDFINTSSISKFYEETFEKYNITHLLISKKSKTNMIISKTEDIKYKELYSDDNFIIYERIVNVE